VVDLLGGEVPDSHLETVQLTRYELGQFYKWHHDSLSEDHPDLLKSGQRIATVLVYLNTVSDGSGCTHFFTPKLKVAPESGAAVVFFPSDCETGARDDRTLHEAQPVSETAVKYVLQIWVKQRPFRPKDS
jgi:prolyl 4-hydroxylase